jgi:hypothetical protein
MKLVTACGSCRGGGPASCLYSFLNQGDPGLRCVTLVRMGRKHRGRKLESWLWSVSCPPT